MCICNVDHLTFSSSCMQYSNRCVTQNKTSLSEPLKFLICTNLVQHLTLNGNFKHFVTETAEFIEPLKDINAKVGQTVTLECRISNAKADVKWYKDGYQVYTIDKYTVVKEGQRRAVTIKKVGPEDIGKFRCVCGDLHTEAKLNVRGRMIISNLQA